MPTNLSPYSPLTTDESTPSLRVSQAISLCNSLLTDLSLKIEGEVANFSINRGKFVFFDLKDEEEEARISCFMMAFNLSTPIEDGMRVIIEGRPGLYQKNGQFRITVNRIEPKGQGSVKRAFELLSKKLEGEGLFASERKRTLKKYVQTVGIISSSEAAGFGDFKTIALQRLPGIQFILANVAVQGRDAESEICKAFDHLNSYYSLDAIVLIRGGGSMEDLHAFNSELVARAIVRSKAPVIVGVGHERDITIADFCADIRAATPSNAAQLLLPTLDEVKDLVIKLTQQGRREVEKTIQYQKEKTLYTCEKNLQKIQTLIEHKQQKVEHLIKNISSISPEQTLKRGYSITFLSNGSLLTDTNQASKGEQITTLLTNGEIQSVIS